MLLDLLPHRLQHCPADLARVVGKLRLELAGVLVNAGDAWRVELKRVVVGEELELLALGFGVAGRSLGEAEDAA